VIQECFLSFDHVVSYCYGKNKLLLHPFFSVNRAWMLLVRIGIPFYRI